MSADLWPEDRTALFDEVDRAARPWRVIRTHQDQPCILHSEPGPELYRAEDGTGVLVTDAVREQWDREGVSLVIRKTYVGTCHTAGCEPGKPGSERWQ